jgi:hypothetical protein
MIICGSAEKFEELVGIAKEHGCKFLRSDKTIETTIEGLRTGVIEEVEVFLSHKYFDIKNAKLKEE